MENTPNDIITSGYWAGYSEIEVLKAACKASKKVDPKGHYTYYFTCYGSSSTELSLCFDVEYPGGGGNDQVLSSYSHDNFAAYGVFPKLESLPKPKAIEQKLCSCSMSDIMRHGCKCGGK